MKMTIYKHRLVARISLEAVSPLAVGSGEKDIITDAPVARDCNGLPYIPGTSLMGILRHSMSQENIKQLLGYQDKEKGEGSKVIISDALLTDENGKVLDGLQDTDNSEYLRHFQVLPVRQHVKITQKGTAAKTGKFDEQVVYAGTRFVFEIEELSVDGKDTCFKEMLNIISSPTFRIGGGTRCGFGSMKVVSILYHTYDLTQEDDLKAYIKKTSCLEDDFELAQEFKPATALQEGWTKYTLDLTPMDFFLFSSGFGDEEADMTPVKEERIVWENGKPRFTEACTLIPATSVKGAIAHRTAYYWNKLTLRNVEEGTALDCEKCPAIIKLFGTTNNDDDTQQAIGNVILSDVLMEKSTSKVLPHIRIDKFTGGVMDGALFQEKVTIGKGQHSNETLYVKNDALEDSTIKEAFEHALSDICSGLLPLGGGTNRGNGIFTGTLYQEGASKLS